MKGLIARRRSVLAAALLVAALLLAGCGSASSAGSDDPAVTGAEYCVDSEVLYGGEPDCAPAHGDEFDPDLPDADAPSDQELELRAEMDATCEDYAGSPDAPPWC